VGYSAKVQTVSQAAIVRNAAIVKVKKDDNVHFFSFQGVEVAYKQTGNRQSPTINLRRLT